MRRNHKLEAYILDQLHKAGANAAINSFEVPWEPQIETHDPKRVLRASQMHLCERELTIRCRLPYSKKSVSAFSVASLLFGTHTHKVVQGSLIDESIKHEMPVKSYRLAGTADTWFTEESMVLDWKTIGKRYYMMLGNEPKPEHWQQVSYYGNCLGAETAGIVYFCKLDQQLPAIILEPSSIRAFTGPPIADQSLLWDQKASRIEAHLALGTLPEYKDCKDCVWCPVVMECHGKTLPAVAKIRNSHVLKEMQND